MLLTEAYKVKKGLCPVTMNDVFKFGKSSANEHGRDNHLQGTNIQTVHLVANLFRHQKQSSRGVL